MSLNLGTTCHTPKFREPGFDHPGLVISILLCGQELNSTLSSPTAEARSLWYRGVTYVLVIQ